MLFDKFSILIRIFTIAGTKFYLPGSTIFILSYITIRCALAASNPSFELLLVFGLFALILAHELGHLIVANLLGAKIDRTTLYFFGGISEGKKPAHLSQQLLIALAGPITSLIILFLLAGDIEKLEKANNLFNLNISQKLFVFNSMIFFLNLLPFYPFDGNRILKYIVASFSKRKIKSSPSVIGVVLFITVGIISLATLDLIGLVAALTLIDLASRQTFINKLKDFPEAQNIKAMMNELSDIKKLNHGQSLLSALDTAIKSFEPIFPIMLGEQVLGVVNRDKLIKRARITPDETVNSIIEPSLPRVSVSTPINKLVTEILSGVNNVFLVIENDKPVGLLFKDKIFEHLVSNLVKE